MQKASGAGGRDYAASQQTLRRAIELDALEAVLPFYRRDRLAEILSDDDVATLARLARQGTGDNSLRALASDLAYLESWALAATGSPLPWPAPEALALMFIAHHLFDPVRRDADPDHGMPDTVSDALRAQGLLRTTGPHAPATVRRRLSSWATLTRARGLSGIFTAPSLKNAISLAVRASAPPPQRKSREAVTADILDVLLKASAGDRLADIRDRAILLVAFASGGRRRSEIAGLRIEDLRDEGPVHLDPEDLSSAQLACLSIRLGRTETATAERGDSVILLGRPVTALKLWLTAAGITQGSVFRRVDRWGNVEHRAITPQSVNLIVKSRAKAAGLDPALFSAHGLRAGYLTEAARRGISLPEAMLQSRHRSVQQAAQYYSDADRKRGGAVRLVT